MTDTHVPPDCLADARRVLAEQDPELATLADRWPARWWRAAVKVALAEMEAQSA